MAPFLRAAEPSLRAAYSLQLARRTHGVQAAVSEYQDRFEALLHHVGTLMEAQRVQAFTAGLRPPLILDVEIHNPSPSSSP